MENALLLGFSILGISLAIVCWAVAAVTVSLEQQVEREDAWFVIFSPLIIAAYLIYIPAANLFWLLYLKEKPTWRE